MSSGCGDVLSLADLQTAKKHQIFEAEVITGKSGGVAGGADIDYATNQVTGQTQKTLPAILRDAGFRPASFTFVTGGTLNVGDSDMAVLWPISGGGDGQYYIWKGAYPKTIPAASTPTSTGGVSASGWLPLGDITLRTNLRSGDGTKLIGICQTIADLKGITANPGERVQVKGYHPFSGVGGGDFVYVESIPDGWLDEGIFIKSTSMPGYWQRLGEPTGMSLLNWGLANNASTSISDLGDVLNRAMIHNRHPIIPAGSWLMSSIARIPSNTIISGEGMGNTIILREGSTNAMFVNKSDGITGGYGAAANIALEDFTIDARMDDYPAPCTPIGTGHAANIRVSRVQVNNVPGRWHAIELNATYGAVVEDCIFNRGGLDQYEGECIQLDAALAGGPFPWFGPYDSTICCKIHINRCTFNDWSTAIGSHSGVSGSRWIDLRVTDCDMKVSKAGVKCIGWSGVIISRNRILYQKSSGYPDTVKFYPIVLNPSTNVVNSDVIITDNQIVWDMENVSGSDHRGIQVKGNGTDATGTYRNVIISNNIVRGSFRTHISVDDIIDAKVSNNKVQPLGNFASGASNFAGIALYGTRNGTVTQNTIEGGFHLIISKGAQTISMERVVVSSNDVAGNIGIDNEFSVQAVTGNVCNSISGGTKLLSAKTTGKYRSQSVTCVGNVETGVSFEGQIATS